ncbi:MAG: hypothetical protein ACM3Q2_18910 [Syntrophothermus sp.]
MYKHMLAVFLFMVCFTGGQTENIVSAVRLANLNNEDTDIPSLGEKVTVIFYVDPDVQRLTRPVSDALEEIKFSLERNAFIGIVNCKETWLPNPLIRMKARKEQELHPKSVILMDNDRLLARAWKLGDCNNKFVLLIIGTDLRVLYNKVIGSEDESKAAVPGFIQVLRTAQKKD